MLFLHLSNQLIKFFFTKHGSKVHCAFLGASKAFDKVLINGLLGKLIERKLPFHFIHLAALV